MKKNYVKPCSSCMLVVAEQAMLAGSGSALTITHESAQRGEHLIVGPNPPTPPTPVPGTPAKKNPFQYDEE